MSNRCEFTERQPGGAEVSPKDEHGCMRPADRQRNVWGMIYDVVDGMPFERRYLDPVLDAILASSIKSQFEPPRGNS